MMPVIYYLRLIMSFFSDKLKYYAVFWRVYTLIFQATGALVRSIT